MRFARLIASLLLNNEREAMKILGLNSTVTINGVSAKVTGIQSKTITVTGSKDTLKLSLRKVNKMIDDKILVIS
jgi:hypothetical protein|tara:strand:- start:65 stop:286 length:222 start_codon:yes stop_codon:yes gene_type:complete